VAGQVQRVADVRARLPRHQRIVTPAHLAFRLAWKALVEPGCNHQAKHPVTKEFEPLIGVAAMAAVGQRTLEQLGLRRGGAKRLGNESGKFDQG
jgi:hypothetical protein